MDPRRAQTERNALPQVGATFSREDGTVMFTFVIDPGNVLGPRPATRADQQAHAGAWAAFTAAEGVSSLDRDARGGHGGSLPVESPPKAPVEAVTLTTPNDDTMFVPSAVGAEIEKAVGKPKRKYTRRQKG
jgi:hypothetical protein